MLNRKEPTSPYSVVPTGERLPSESSIPMDDSYRESYTPPPPAWPDRPWIAIWTKPRGTVRAIVETDPARYVLLLAAVAGIAEMLNRASNENMGEDTSLWTITMLAVILGSVGGVTSLYIGGAVLRWVGGLLGGRAKSEEVRAAVAWSSIPRIAAMFLWIPYVALYGKEMFTSSTVRIDANPIPLLLLVALEFIIELWGLFLLVKTLAEVHRFSVWRAMGTLALPIVAIFGFGYGCALLVS